jgi:hypothetical protein
MGSAEVLGADVANVCRMQLRIEEVVHACLHQKCELVETESSDWLLKSQTLDIFMESIRWVNLFALTSDCEGTKTCKFAT